jgi:hypothetical protein
VTNFEPLVAMKMPRYDTLDLAIPPLTRMLREVDRVRPDVIHISTPGPVGLVGLIASRMMRCPVVGVYHTDFPAYIDRLFDDHVLTQTCSHAMRMFYKTFRAIFTRSEDYAASLERMGIERSRLTRLLPGIDLAAFNPGYRDVTIWDRLPAARVPRGAASRHGTRQPGASAVLRACERRKEPAHADEDLEGCAGASGFHWLASGTGDRRRRPVSAGDGKGTDRLERPVPRVPPRPRAFGDLRIK